MTTPWAAIVLTTVSNAESAREVARDLVDAGLAGCVQRFPIESTYRWEGHVEEGGETLLLIKTTSERLDDVERRVHELSDYDVPEFIVLRSAAVSPRYLAWLRAAVRSDRDDG
jgi:periplasmic divalent cation tolerance protein